MPPLCAPLNWRRFQPRQNPQPPSWVRVEGGDADEKLEITFLTEVKKLYYETMLRDLCDMINAQEAWDTDDGPIEDITLELLGQDDYQADHVTSFGTFLHRATCRDGLDRDSHGRVPRCTQQAPQMKASFFDPASDEYM